MYVVREMPRSEERPGGWEMTIWGHGDFQGRRGSRSEGHGRIAQNGVPSNYNWMTDRWLQIGQEGHKMRREREREREKERERERERRKEQEQEQAS
jgi:hypothetical protein